MRRVLRRAFLPVSVVVLVVAALTVPLPWFVESPGRALSLDGDDGEAVAGMVQVSAPDATPVNGDYLLTAVSFQRATPASWLLAVIDDASDLVPVSRVVPEGQRDATYFDAQREVFASTADIAAGVGLEAAGYDVGFTGDGAVVLGVEPRSPADGVLSESDVIVAVDGARVDTVEELIAALRDPDAPPGPRNLTVLRGDEELAVELRPRRLTPGSPPQLGVTVRTANERILLPVDVAVDAGRVGGPSAGLMIALTVFDLADPVDLAAGRTIAGTGSIRPDGTVGEIGGIGYKAIAADRMGAQVFLAPATQATAARAALPPGSDLEVIGVTVFDEAVDALRPGPTGAV